MSTRMVVLGVALLLLVPSSVRAKVTVTALGQSVSTSVRVVRPFGLIITDADHLSSSTFPPVSMAVSSVTTYGPNFGFAQASIDVLGYDGPSAVGDSTPGLLLNVAVAASIHLNESATAGFGYKLSLDEAQPYSLTGTFNQFSGVFGPGGRVPVGTGVLGPGTYQVDAIAVSAGNVSLNFAITVPEPVSLGMIPLLGLVCAPGRRHLPRGR